MPATVELLETPPSPTARITSWILCSMVVLFVLWGILGKMDIVAQASGRIIPSGHSKTIQSIDTATVRAIHVKEGMPVKKEQLLVELDPTMTAADKTKTQDALLHTIVTIARSEALLVALNDQGVPDLIVPPEIDLPENQENMRVLNEYWLQSGKSTK